MGCRTERYALAGGHLNHATETTHETGSSDECRAAAPRGATDWDGGLASLGGTYLSERAWGTVREDYSPHGEAWEPALSILHLVRNPAIGGLHANNTHSAFSKVNPARKC